MNWDTEWQDEEEEEVFWGEHESSILYPFRFSLSSRYLNLAPTWLDWIKSKIERRRARLALEIYYSSKLIEVAQLNTVLDNFNSVKPLPSSRGKSIHFVRYEVKNEGG